MQEWRRKRREETFVLLTSNILFHLFVPSYRMKNRKEITDETKIKFHDIYIYILDRKFIDPTLASKTFFHIITWRRGKNATFFSIRIFDILDSSLSRPSRIKSRNRWIRSPVLQPRTVELFARFIRGYRDRSRLVFYKSASLLTTSCSPHALFISFYPARRIFYFDQGHDSFQSCPRRRLFRF